MKPAFSTHFIAATTDMADYGHPVPAPAFRREFVLPRGAVKSASLTVCGLGLYECYLNGRRITRGHFSPYISNPDHFFCYDRYDLTDALAAGENVLGFVLGNGLQNCFGGRIWELDKLPCRSAPKLALTFEAVCEGGRLSFDARDGFVWAPSGILLDDLRAGEHFDARVLPDDWCTPGFDAANWRTPLFVEAPAGQPRIADVDPILPRRSLTPVSIRAGRIGRMPDIDRSLPVYPIPKEEQAGYIYDFGENGAGLCRLTLRNAEPGRRITLQFAEKLTAEGDLDLWSMFYAPQAYSQRDVYITRGGAEETYLPSFTYHGFRYCLVTGIAQAEAVPELLTYVMMNTALSPRAGFSCSDETANRIWAAGMASDLSNFYHFPTDCPQREKNGWTGDASLSAEQLLLCLPAERNLREWLCHIRAAMRPDGALPGIVPTGSWGLGHGPAWDNVMVMLPYFIWRLRGDTAVLCENAEAIRRQLSYMRARISPEGLCDYGLGDWCPAGGGAVTTPTVVTSTLTCLDYCRRAEAVFSALSMTAEAAEARAAADILYAGARAHLILPATASVLGNTLTGQAMALHIGLFTPDELPAARARLLDQIDRAGGSFAGCGILGLRVLFHVLADMGEAALAYRLIAQEKFPSYGYMMARGATTLWETFHDFDGPSPSLNHHFFGDVLSWLLQNAVGIRPCPDGNGADTVLISPAPIPALSHAEGYYDAPAGRISVAWVRAGSRIRLSYSVPDGVTAHFAKAPAAPHIPLFGTGDLCFDAP